MAIFNLISGAAHGTLKKYTYRTVHGKTIAQRRPIKIRHRTEQAKNYFELFKNCIRIFALLKNFCNCRPSGQSRSDRPLNTITKELKETYNAKILNLNAIRGTAYEDSIIESAEIKYWQDTTEMVFYILLNRELLAGESIRLLIAFLDEKGKMLYQWEVQPERKYDYFNFFFEQALYEPTHIVVFSRIKNDNEETLKGGIYLNTIKDWHNTIQ